MRLYRDRVIEAAADLLRRNAAFREDVVLIKSHAREDPAKFEPAVTSVPGNRLRLAPPDVDPFELGLAAGAVFGMFSMLLVESALAGIPAMSFQPTTDRDQRVRLGYGVRELDSLDDLLPVTTAWRPSADGWSYGAATRVCDVVQGLAEERSADRSVHEESS